MDSPLIGVIPLIQSGVSYISMSLSKLIAVGIEYSVYIFDSSVGENIARLNHYPHFTNAACWHPQRMLLFTSDTSGDLLLTDFKPLSSEKRGIPAGFTHIECHHTSDYLFVQYPNKLSIFNSNSIEKLRDIDVSGFKAISDYFYPTKLFVISNDSIWTVRNFLDGKVITCGKLDNIVDSVVNPAAFNGLFVLTKGKLLEYDTYAGRTTRTVNVFDADMKQILSSYSNEIWCLSSAGIITPYNSLIPVSYLKAHSSITNKDNKLPFCYIGQGLELCYGEVSNCFELTARVKLGVSLQIWGIGYLQGKILVYYQHPCIHCFSIQKERVIRSVSAPNLTILACWEGLVYYVHKESHFDLVEWKLRSGETRILKSYGETVYSLAVHNKGKLLAVVTQSAVDILDFSKENIGESFSIEKPSSAVWAESDQILYVSSTSALFKLLKDDEGNFILSILLQNAFEISEVLEISGAVYVKASAAWKKLVNAELVADIFVKNNEICIKSTKAELKSFGLLYRTAIKGPQWLEPLRGVIFEPTSTLDSLVRIKHKSEEIGDSLVDMLIAISEYENSVQYNIFWRIVKELSENAAEDAEDNEKFKARLKDRSLQSSPCNITPTRREVKRSTSPLTKSRKSITPQRMVKMQSDPKELIQLAVDTSSLLSTTQNFTKETSSKPFYILETNTNVKPNSIGLADYLTADRRGLVKKLQASEEEQDLLMSCVIAGSLGRQELQKAIEVACQKLQGYTGVALNLVAGSRSKAWEILADTDCKEDIAYYSRVSGKSHDFFAWIIKLFEDGFGFTSGLHLLAAGYILLALQVFCKSGEERVAYWLSKVMDGKLKNLKEVPSEFEGWFYELGPPRFKSRLDDELQALILKYERN